MPLFCGKTEIKKSGDRQRMITKTTAYVEAAQTAQCLAKQSTVEFNGAEVDRLVVLQGECGAVCAGTQPSEPGPTSICSVDATTCVIVAFRDPKTKRVALAHLDHGGEQTSNAVTQLLMHVLDTTELPGSKASAGPASSSSQVVELDDDEAESFAVNLDVYLLGAVVNDKYSPETAGDLLMHLSSNTHVRFDLVPDGVCIWNLNTVGKPGEEGYGLIHRGLSVDALSGAAQPVECLGAGRAYPAGRLRALRCMNQANNVSSISLFPGEEIKGKTSLGDRQPPRANFVVVRPFAWPEFARDTIQQPLPFFAKMSTTPTLEPVDFAACLKSSVVYGSVTKPTEVFPKGDSNVTLSPVAFAVTPVTVMEKAPPRETADDEAPAPETVAVKKLGWVQISLGRGAN